ncbi:MAG: hypothetical protein IIA41_01670 [SAR324 cluster bacterium]|nr:hypothetical protein [SAR324 cluster bacterium]
MISTRCEGDGTGRLSFGRLPVGLGRMRIPAAGLLCGAALAGWGAGPAAATEGPRIGERPVVETHLDQARINAGDVNFDQLFEHGRLLFSARFNKLDGQGRPATTGAAAPRIPDEPPWTRIATPGTNSCAGCHYQPEAGGAGDFVANAFVGANGTDPVTLSLSPRISMERNSVALHGAGPIEMLAREMSAEMIAIREEARETALARVEAGEDPMQVYETRDLITKGVNFGKIRVRGDGKVNPSRIEGVDWDLIIKAFHQKGAKVSLREFASRAMNLHHGMQAVEKFGADKDPDRDGVTNELTVGDITALAIFQAGLGTPGRKIPTHPYVFRAVGRGKALFERIGCGECHLPVLRLNDRHFYEPNPFNPTRHALRKEGLGAVLKFDMTRAGLKPRLEADGNGALVRAFTDLKRHNVSDGDYNHFANEQRPMGTLFGYASRDSFYAVPANPNRPNAEFLTAKLWFVGNTDPYGHRGDLTMITEAIYQHGGEARESRDGFFALSEFERDAVVEYLKTLQILPAGSPRVVFEDGIR